MPIDKHNFMFGALLTIKLHQLPGFQRSWLLQYQASQLRLINLLKQEHQNNGTIFKFLKLKQQARAILGPWLVIMPPILIQFQNLVAQVELNWLFSPAQLKCTLKIDYFLTLHPIPPLTGLIAISTEVWCHVVMEDIFSRGKVGWKSHSLDMDVVLVTSNLLTFHGYLQMLPMLWMSKGLIEWCMMKQLKSLFISCVCMNQATSTLGKTFQSWEYLGTRSTWKNTLCVER